MRYLRMAYLVNEMLQGFKMAWVVSFKYCM